MTPAEYIQLKAFARIDGALLSLLWISCFACSIIGITNTFYGMVALLLMLVTPFFVGKRLAKFRDEGRCGVISLSRGWAYSVFVFFYAAILLAVAQYVYFAYMDHGYMLMSFTNALSTPEAKQMVEHYGIQQAMNESIEMMGELRPIDYALNVLTMNIMAGIVLGLPIAAIIKRQPKS